MPRTLRSVPDIPKVSVLLPVWNGERFLAEAIESILRQTLESLELVVIDDGSTDGSLAIAEGFAARDARVVLIHTPHRGLPSALNAGTAAARGRYVARMDADDVSLPARLARQAAYLDANVDVVAVGSSVEVIDETGAFLGHKTFAASHERITAALLVGLTPFSHPATMMRRTSLLSIGGYAVDRYPSDDFDLWLRLSEIGKVANLDEPLVRYRRHAGAIGIRERDQQLNMSQSIVNEARARRSLAPLRRRLLSAGTSHEARYHFECARFALLSGPRRAALRHARASIAFEPSWPEPYVALLACALPKWFLRRFVAYSAFARALDMTPMRDAANENGPADPAEDASSGT